MNLLFPSCNIGKFNYIEMYLVTNQIENEIKMSNK